MSFSLFLFHIFDVRLAVYEIINSILWIITTNFFINFNLKCGLWYLWWCGPNEKSRGLGYTTTTITETFCNYPKLLFSAPPFPSVLHFTLSKFWFLLLQQRLVLDLTLSKFLLLRSSFYHSKYFVDLDQLLDKFGIY